MRDDEITNFEIQITQVNGLKIWVNLSVKLYPNKDRIGLVVIDITEQKRAQLQVEKSLVEKETLIRELYHRTKNNMQVISSMLDMQADYSKDRYIKEVFTDTKNRIQAMALVHRKLYQADDLSNINLKDYF